VFFCINKDYSVLKKKKKKTDKPGLGDTLKLNEIGEQFENIQLTRNERVEKLHMQHMLGQYLL